MEKDYKEFDRFHKTLKDFKRRDNNNISKAKKYCKIVKKKWTTKIGWKTWKVGKTSNKLENRESRV